MEQPVEDMSRRPGRGPARRLAVDPAERGRERVAALLASVRTPLYANAYALLANQVSSAALGFLYWLLAARLYPVEVVGRSSALISMLLLIAGLAQLGLGSGMLRFVPRAGRHARRLILYAYAAVLGAATALSLGFLWLSEALHFTGKLSAEGVAPAVLVAATMAWSVFYFQDGILSGLQKSQWVLIENFVYNVGKIALLVLGVWFLGEAGIVGSWFLPTPVCIALVLWLVLGRYVRREGLRSEAADDRPLTAREVVSTAAGDHVGSVVSETSVRLLPLMVVGILGAAANAYFYQAWLVANTLTLAASGMSNSFTAQAAADRDNIGTHSRGILRHMFVIIAPVALLIGVGAPLVLGLFGARYVEAAPLLRVLAMTAPLVVFNMWYLSYSRVEGKIREVVGVQAAASVLLLALGYVGLHTFGIVGVGLAWLVSQGAVALFGVVDARRVLFAQPQGESARRLAATQRLLRRADWRFLLPSGSAGKTALFAGGSLARSAEVGGGDTVGGEDRSGSDRDVALARDPDAAGLRAAYRVLRPGGACYAEWRTWRAGGAAAVIRKMQAAGFVGVRTYWAPPIGGERARLWLALPADEAYRRAVAEVVRPGRSGVTRRIASAGVDAVLRTGLAPTLAVVGHKPHESGDAPADFPDWLLARMRESCGTAEGRTLVMTGSGRCSQKVHWLVFEGDPPALRWVVKMPRRVGDAAILRRERHVLRLLEERGDVRDVVVPLIALYTEEPGFPVTVESALVGPTFEQLARKTAYATLADRAGRALAGLARGGPAALPDEWWDRLVEPWLARLELQLDRLGDRELAPAIRHALSGIGPLPLAWSHGDCAPWNVVETRGGLGLFDWEAGGGDALPVLDLTYLLATMAFAAEGTGGTRRAAATYERLLLGAGERGRAFHAALEAYAAEVGVPEHDVSRLRIVTWLVHAVHDLDNVMATDASSRRLNARAVCLPLLRTELAHAGAPDRRP